MSVVKEIDRQFIDILLSNKILCIKSALPPILDETNSIRIGDINEFISFLQRENIKSVFNYSFELSAEDFYIDDEIADEHTGCSIEDLDVLVRQQIIVYNNRIEKYNFDGLMQICYFVLFNGFIVYYSNSDKIPLDDPSDKLAQIIESTKDKIHHQRCENQKAVAPLKDKLKQQILSDPSFALQTNQRLRRSYAIDIWYNLSGEYEPLKQYWSSGGHMKPQVVDFIDLIWAEYKQSIKSK